MLAKVTKLPFCMFRLQSPRHIPRFPSILNALRFSVLLDIFDAGAAGSAIGKPRTSPYIVIYITIIC